MSERSVDQAFVLCESITRERARNFYYGIRLLAPDRRAALCAVYALARRIDDIGDGQAPRAAKLDALTQARSSLADLDRPGSDPVFTAVADVARRLPLPLGAFDELLDGVEMDVAGRRYADFDELAGYCRCVAGSVGRLCLAVFGSCSWRARGPPPGGPRPWRELCAAAQRPPPPCSRRARRSAQCWPVRGRRW